MDHTQLASVESEHATLLVSTKLKLAADVCAQQLSVDRVVVKYPPSRDYLVLSPLQWRALQDFREEQIVPDALLQAITGGRCPPLREYYELALKASRRGFLQGAGLTPPAPVKSVAWKIGWSGTWVRWATTIAAAGAILYAVTRSFALPDSALAWLVAWVTACVGLSLGNVIAAGVVRGAGCEPNRPRFWWKTALPHFEIDLRDAIMGGRQVAINAAWTRVAVSLLCAGLVAGWRPAALLPIVFGLLLQFSPLWPSPVSDLLQAQFRDLQLDTSYDLLFVRNRLLTLLFNAQQKFADRKFLMASALATVGWLASIFVFSAMLLRANALELLRRFNEAGGLRVSAMVLLIALSAMLLGAVALAGWIAASHMMRWLREKADRALRPQTVTVAADSVKTLLENCPLFRELPAEDLAQLAATARPEEFPAGAFVTREGETGDKLFVVFSGRLRVSQRLQEIGRTDAFGELGPGDVFGERALLGDGHRTATVRCADRCVLLAFGKDEFSALVLSHISREAIEDKVQKTGFLQRIELSRQWSQQTIARFVRKAKFYDVPKDAMIARAGAEFPYFCLIHEGEFAIDKNGTQVGRLRRGDYYGELSMLWHNTAKANIVALTAGRCLLIPAEDFLAFITRDVGVVMQFEKIGTDKLGRPVFGESTRSIQQAQVSWSAR